MEIISNNKVNSVSMGGIFNPLNYLRHLNLLNNRKQTFGSYNDRLPHGKHSINIC